MTPDVAMTDHEVTNHGGPIDPFSPHSLYDVINGDVPLGESFEYEGLHITAGGEDHFIVYPDGFTGLVMEFSPDDYDDVLELVDDLNRERTLVWEELDQEGRREEFGPQVTNDPSMEGEPGYIYVPDSEKQYK